jgi:Domain of Unknown Function (DUF1259)
MNSDIITRSLAALTLLFVPIHASSQVSGTLDTNAIEHAFGKTGDFKDDVYKVSFPRKDLTVTLKGITLKPSFALGTWMAFKQDGNKAVVDGDLVLTEEEIGPVLGKLIKEGIQVSALHNHLIGETPRLMFLHIEGIGNAVTIAGHLKDALNLTKTPMGPPTAKPLGAAMHTPGDEADFDAELIQSLLGRKGRIKEGVLQVSVARPEPVKMSGAILPPSMGMATAFNFQNGGGTKVAGTGDFVMMRDDVDRVSKALSEHGILITALHNHLVHGSPDLYFMHFWVNDSADKVAEGLRAGLDAMKQG